MTKLMNKTLLTGLLGLLLFGYSSAQTEEELLDDLLETGTEITTSTFKASRIINGHSIEQPARGEMEFRISHRFGKLNGGAYELWGLDQATIHFSLEYSPLNILTVGFGRSNYQKTYDGFVKLKLLRQQKGDRNIPVSISYFGSTELITLKNEVQDFQWNHRLRYTHQLLIARKFSKRFSLQLTPSLVHRNLVETSEMKNSVPALGIAGRFKITNRLSVNAETFLVDHGPTPEGITYYNPLALGIDLETGGHVFQIMITNALPMREAAFITETTGGWTKGDIHLGFNISRMFNLHD